MFNVLALNPGAVADELPEPPQLTSAFALVTFATYLHGGKVEYNLQLLSLANGRVIKKICYQSEYRLFTAASDGKFVFGQRGKNENELVLNIFRLKNGKKHTLLYMWVVHMKGNYGKLS